MKERAPDRIRCPVYTCQSANTTVIDKYYRKRDGAIMRRHQCRDCAHRFSSEQRIKTAA